jgi:hypothetical protein
MSRLSDPESSCATAVCTLKLPRQIIYTFNRIAALNAKYQHFSLAKVLELTSDGLKTEFLQRLDGVPCVCSCPASVSSVAMQWQVIRVSNAYSAQQEADRYWNHHVDLESTSRLDSWVFAVSGLQPCGDWLIIDNVKCACPGHLKL